MFDNPPERVNSDSIKWDRNIIKFGRADVIPLWIADMDFAIAEPISEALAKRLTHPVFGYSYRTEAYTNAIINWLNQRYNWTVSRRELLFYPPGTVAAINCLVNLFTQPDDEIIVHTPAYPPLMNIVKQNQRKLVTSPLIKIDNRFEIDWENFESCFNKKTKMLIFCSPHNPTGRVWREDELLRIAELCRRHNVMVISDEVHADLTLPKITHFHFNRLPKCKRPSSVTLISSCKTFNLAALSQSTLICDEPELRTKIQWAINTAQLNLDNVMSATAMQAAYESAHEWLDTLRNYLQKNREMLVDFVNQQLPGVTVCEAEGTYLAWLDFNALNVNHEALAEIFVRDAGVGLYDGKMFGDAGSGFFRINLACSSRLLQKALDQIRAAFVLKNLI
ncbi:MalY/PatB family protein [Aliikangiella marina]|uniref:MalY/PatB family protein n=1 Tax=Aliikangiella marina TaxID=1712262 RepID=UPI00248312FC|nr:PatB family C-S lyase [Aliikangiella marina]